MNIVLIHTHDTGRHLGPFGAPVATPNLEALAARGVLFRNAFSTAPQCSPSRASLMTGQWPHCHGLIGLTHRGFRLADPNRHLPHRLREAGFATCLVGLQHEVPRDRVPELGYDQHFSGQVGERHCMAKALQAVDWLRKNERRPFFLNVGFIETHREFPPAEPSEDARYTAPPPWLPDHAEVRADAARLNTMVRHVDQAVGMILGALDELGLADETLVIYTTDHGIAFPKAKSTLYDAGIGVALIMRGPGGFEGGRVIDALLSQIDVFPTLMELIGREAPDYLQGTSLLPLVRGQAERIHDEIFAEQTWHAAFDPVRCVRTDRYKYIRSFVDSPRVVLPNIDDGPTKKLQYEGGVLARPRPGEELYDLLHDPHEFNNLAGDAQYEEVRARLSARLDEWMKATGDPLRKGVFDPPAGARVTPRDQYSPRLPEE